MRKDWEVKKWSEVLSIINGKNQKKVEDNNGSYPIYGSGGVMGYASDYLCPGNSVIIGRKGNINKPLFVKEKFWNVDTAFGLISKEGILDSKYLFYFCVNYNFEKLNKAVTIPSLTKTDLLNIRIDLPSLQIQQQIVEELDCLTSIFEKQKKQLEELDNLAQSIFYDMFGDPITNPKGMKMNKVSDLTVKMLTGPFGSMLHKSDYTADGIPSINPQNINNRKIITKDIARVSYQKAEELSKYIVRSNNIIVARRGDLKKCAIVTDKEDGWLCGTGSFMLELNKDIFPILFYYQYTSQSIQKYLNDKCIGATLPNLNQKILGDLKIIVPPFELQQQFAAKIEAIEKQKELIKKSIKETEELFNSRMDYYFN